MLQNGELYVVVCWKGRVASGLFYMAASIPAMVSGAASFSTHFMPVLTDQDT